MINFNENYPDTPNNQTNETKIIPLVFMVSVEPVTARSDAESLPDDEITQEIVSNVAFDVNFSIIKSVETGLYSITFLVKPQGVMSFVQTISEKFEDINSEEAKYFIDYSFGVFNPFKRAILTFPEEERSLTDVLQLVRDWKISVKQEQELKE